MLDFQACEDLLFASYNRVAPSLKGYDHETRDLTAMRQLFAQAGLRLDLAPTMTVTGSKGKGSTALLGAAMLQGMGYTVGLVTSPSFLSVRERIRLNGRAISEADFGRVVNDLAPLIQDIDAALLPGKYLSPTGLFLAAALRYFAEVGVTAMVLEVGRGGRFDDVSLVENAVSVMTPIMSEHLDKLGPTVADIAWHKAGIIKPGGVVISAPQLPEVSAVLQRETAAQNARVIQVGDGIRYTQAVTPPEGQTIGVELRYLGLQERFMLRSPAVYQGLNVAVAYGAAAMLFPEGELQGEAIRSAMSQLRLPGRCDQVSQQPVVMIDGAINRDSALQFRDSVLAQATRPLVLVTALPQDKDFPGFLEALAPLADQVIVTQVSAGHLHFTDEVVTVARRFSGNVLHQPVVDEAFALALATAGAQGTVWVVGTQSLVRDGLRFWRQDLESVMA